MKRAGNAVDGAVSQSDLGVALELRRRASEAHAEQRRYHIALVKRLLSGADCEPGEFRVKAAHYTFEGNRAPTIILAIHRGDAHRPVLVAAFNPEDLDE